MRSRVPGGAVLWARKSPRLRAAAVNLMEKHSAPSDQVRGRALVEYALAHGLCGPVNTSRPYLLSLFLSVLLPALSPLLE